MNQVDCYVTKILSEPFEKYGRWWVKVEYESWGRPGTTELMFDSAAEAKAVAEGLQFLA